MTTDASRGTYPAVLAVVAASTFLAMAAYTAPFGNAVSLTAALRATPAESSWILASMSVGLAATLLAAGVVADRIGRHAVFEIGSLIFVGANIVSAAAPEAIVFVIARVIAGIGATGMIATGLGLVSATAREPRHHTATATVWSIMMGAGIAVGPVVAGMLDLVGAWRWLYVFFALGGLAIWISAHRTCRPRHSSIQPARSTRFDILGFVLITAFLAVLVTAIVLVRSAGPTTSTLLFALAAALLAGFVLSQRLGTRRLIQPSLFVRKDFLATTTAGLGAGLGIVGVMAFAPTYFVAGVGLSTLQAGSMSALWASTSAVAALVLARRTARISGPVQLMLGLGGAALGAGLMTGIGESSGAARLIVSLIVAGVAAGVLNTGLARQAVASVPAEDAATGTAANNTARYLGVAIGVSLASLITTNNATVHGWNLVVWIGAGASLIATIAVAGLSRTARNTP